MIHDLPYRSLIFALLKTHSQTELAKRLGVSQAAISRGKTGRELSPKLRQALDRESPGTFEDVRSLVDLEDMRLLISWGPERVHKLLQVLGELDPRWGNGTALNQKENHE